MARVTGTPGSGLEEPSTVAELSEVLGYPATAGAGAEFGRRPLLVEGTRWWPRRSLGCVDVGNPRSEPHMIRQLASGKYRLYSKKKDPKTGKRRNLGTFNTRGAAEKHERAVQFFKRRG